MKLLLFCLFNLITLSALAQPLVDPATQKARDVMRVNILQAELDKEQVLFTRARQELSSAVTAKASDNKIAALQAVLEQHQKNIAAINRELEVKNNITVPAIVELHQVANSNKATEITKAVPSWDVYARAALQK